MIYENTMSIDSDDLISLCEYIWNFCDATLKYAHQAIYDSDYDSIEYMIKTIQNCVDDIAHTMIKKENLIIIVPKKADIVAVSEIVKKDLAVSVLEYHHYGLKGNLPKKKAILKLLADDIELQRKNLNGVNKTLSDNLFQMLQKFVRHNNENNLYIKGLSSDKLEACYDDIYQMWLLAKLEIDNLERKKRVEDTLKQINA